MSEPGRARGRRGVQARGLVLSPQPSFVPVFTPCRPLPPRSHSRPFTPSSAFFDAVMLCVVQQLLYPLGGAARRRASHRTPWRALPLEMWCKLCRCMCTRDGVCLAVSRCVRERTHSIGRGHILLARRGLSSSLSRCVRPWQYLFPMPRACAAARHVRPRNTAHHKPKTHTDSSR